MNAMLRPMTARGRDEPHRTATPLELFFDLCFVVAVAQAGARLVVALAEGHPGHGITGYLFVFFGIWWAWMNFSWFASAYDTDDVLYRVATLVQIAGVLVYAAGVPRAFDDNDWAIAVLGYVVMRLAMTFQWVRAAHAERGAARRTAARYAVGVVVCQGGWVAMLWVPAGGWRVAGFAVLIAAELSVPLLAEHGHRTGWHPEHIAERYGLFTLIVLGETVAAATVAVQSAIDEHEALDDLLPLAGGGLLIVFAAWWVYFAVPIHGHLTSNREAVPWGYGHYLIFSSAAAIGAGIEVAVEQAVGAAHPDAGPGAGPDTSLDPGLVVALVPGDPGWRSPAAFTRAAVAGTAVRMNYVKIPFGNASIRAARTSEGRAALPCWPHSRGIWSVHLKTGIKGIRRASAVALAAGAVLTAGVFAVPAQAATLKTPTITARGGFVMNNSTKTTYFTKSADTRRSTGSTTKIMTADVVLAQTNLNLDHKVTVQKAYSDYIVSKGASSAHLIVGDKLTVRQLLYGMMLPSGCDAAYALADTYGSGSTRSARVKSFIGKMNAKAKSLGLKNTHFDSFDGIGNGSNYSTPRDLTKIASDAMKNSTFRTVVKTRSTEQKVTTKSGGYRYMSWTNTDTLLGSYSGSIGVKTGSGPAAGYCLVFAATRNGKTVIGTVLDDTSVTVRASDAEKLMDYGFKK